MRTIIFLAVCFCLACAAGSVCAVEWVEYQPPMMDDATVDPLRFTKKGEFFDLSDPIFVPLEHGQSCKASRSGKTAKDKLVIDYEFTGRDGLEYLEIQTNFKIDKPGFSIGGVFNNSPPLEGQGWSPKTGAIRVRLRDPSGEIHQHTLGYPRRQGYSQGPIFATIETSPEVPWGGDGDKKLQFPCEIVSILLDRPEPGFKGKGTLKITHLALYEAVELRDVLKIEFAADSPPGLLFEGNGTLKLRLTPKNLLEPKNIEKLEESERFEKLHIQIFEARPDYELEKWLVEAVKREQESFDENELAEIACVFNTPRIPDPPFIDKSRIILNGMTGEERVRSYKRMAAYVVHEGALSEVSDDEIDAILSIGVDDYDWRPTLELVGNHLEGWQIPPEGVVVEIPITAPGASRVVINTSITKYGFSSLYQRVVMDDRSNIPALPVAFSFGSIKPNMPQDERLGVCTHYQQGWNTNSLDFAVKAGSGMIRDEMTWASVERQKGVLAVPNFATYIDKALEKNLEPLVILNYSNRFYDDNGFPATDEAVAGFADYCRFVAEQFQGRIRYFEIWNEWFIGCGMNHAMDRKTNTPENYVKMLKATHAAVKAANPQAYIVGGGGDHPQHHLDKIEALFELGVLEYCDAFSIHPYRQPRTPEESGLVAEVVHIADLMKKHGVKEPKLWITEIGWPTPKKHPAADAELFQAAMVVRSAVPLLATGVVEKYFWYDLKNDGLDRIDQEHNFGILRHDRLGLQIKPAFVAFAVMSSNTADRGITKDETLSQDGVHAYRLTKNDKPDRLVLWVEQGEKTIRLPPVSAITNLFGTPLTFSSNSVTITEEPIWVTL